jgi:hypothetical protein
MDKGQPGPRVIPERLELRRELCKWIESSLIAMTKRQGERGQPWRRPCWGAKESVGSPLTKMEKVVVEMQA